MMLNHSTTTAQQVIARLHSRVNMLRIQYLNEKSAARWYHKRKSFKAWSWKMSDLKITKRLLREATRDLHRALWIEGLTEVTPR